MTGEFATGLGQSDVTFGPDTMQSQMMASSPGVTAAVNGYLNTGKTSGLYTFGLSQVLAAGLNPIQQFVGSYTYNIQPVEGGLLITLSNYTSVWSGSYHQLPSHQRASSSPLSNPFGTTHQTYQVLASCQ